MANNGQPPQQPAQQPAPEFLREAQKIQSRGMLEKSPEEMQEQAIRDAQNQAGGLEAMMGDVIHQLREIAHYSTKSADNLQLWMVDYRKGVQRLMGKLPK